MAFVNLPWLQFAPDTFLSSIIAGRKAAQDASELEERGREANMQAQEQAAALGHRDRERQDALDQQAREFAQKRMELLDYRQQRGQERQDALDALNKNREDNLELRREVAGKPRFFQTGNGGIFKIGKTGDLETVRQPDAKADKVKIAIGVNEKGESILQSIQADKAREALEKSGYVGWSKNPYNIAALGFASRNAPEEDISVPESVTNRLSATTPLLAPTNKAFETNDVQPIIPRTAKEKAALANELAAKNPSWTRKQILEAVNGQ